MSCCNPTSTDVGPTGPAGAPGAPGAPGADGATGPTGPAGPGASLEFVNTDATESVGTIAETVQTLVTSALVAGDYVISWYCETDPDTAGASATVQISLASVGIIASTRHGDEVDVLDVTGRSGYYAVTLGAGVQTITMVAITTAGTVLVGRRRLMIQGPYS